jgi:hypothetical protein
MPFAFLLRKTELPSPGTDEINNKRQATHSCDSRRKGCSQMAIRAQARTANATNPSVFTTEVCPDSVFLALFLVRHRSDRDALPRRHDSKGVVQRKQDTFFSRAEQD